MEWDTVRNYGVTRQTSSGDAVSRAAEALDLIGYAVVDSGLSKVEQRAIAESFDRLRQQQEARYGRDALLEVDEHNTIRAPLIEDDVFLNLAQNQVVLRLCEAVFGSAYILNQQNGVINPPQDRYNQGVWHRDLPYQHFVSSKPLAINALYCIDPFFPENGATKVIPGSHKQECFPSDDVVRSLQTVVSAPAGSFIVLDCMTFHSGSQNTTDRVRRAVNHVFTLPFIKPQITLQSSMQGRALSAQTRRLLDFDNHPAEDVAAYLARRRAKAQMIKS